MPRASGSKLAKSHSTQVSNLLTDIPNQVVQKKMVEGFQFNVLAVGETACGKSTLLESLFDFEFEKQTPTHSETKTSVHSRYYDLCRNNVKLKLGLAESVGLGDQIDRTESAKAITEFVKNNLQDYLLAEININKRRSNFHDKRCHLCLYFISPNGVQPYDIELIKELSEIVNLVPIISKADSMTKDELKTLKKKVQTVLSTKWIFIYDFTDHLKNESKRFSQYIPFGVAASREKDNSGKRIRKYKWGNVEIENKFHSEFPFLREAILTENIWQFIKDTNKLPYERFRIHRLHEIGFIDSSKSDKMSSMEKVYRIRKNLMIAKQREREDIIRTEFLLKVEDKKDEIMEHELALQKMREFIYIPLQETYDLIMEEKMAISERVKQRECKPLLQNHSFHYYVSRAS